MSGRTIGTLVGAAVGLAFPALAPIAMTVGGIVGGLLDPETLQGAQFQGGQVGGAQSGQAIPIVFATNTVESRLLDGETEPRLSKRTEDAGKGGPEVEHDVALLNYSLEICESSELRETSIHHVLACWEDEQLVFDVRPGSLLSGADNAKFMANKTIRYGREDQLPSAMLEAIHGVGNVPAYRGLLTVDILDEDLMVRLDGKPRGGRIPLRRWLVSACAAEEVGGTLLVTGQTIADGGPVFAKASSIEPLVFEGIPTATGADVINATPGCYQGAWVAAGDNEARISLDNLVSWQPLAIDRASSGPMTAGPSGWLLAYAQGPVDGFDKTARADPIGSGFSSFAFTSTGAFPAGQKEETYMCRYTGGAYWFDYAVGGYLMKSTDLTSPMECVYFDWNNTGIGRFYDIEEFDGAIYAAVLLGRTGTQRSQLRRSNDGGVTFPDVLIDVANDSDARPLQLLVGGDILLVQCYLDAYVWTSEDGFAAPHATGISTAGVGTVPIHLDHVHGRHIAFSGDKFYLISGLNGANPSLGDKCVSTPDGLTFSAPVSLPIADLYGIASSDEASAPVYTGTPIPDAEGYFIDRTTGQTQGPDLTEPTRGCTLTLAELVRRIYNIAAPQLGEDHFDLTALVGDLVRGYKVQDLGLTAADAIEPLRRVFTFDLPEFDQKIRARKRGGDVDWVIDTNVIVVGEDNTLDDRRGAPLEYPRTVRVHYLSPVLDYKPTEQVSPDVSPDFEGVGEENINTFLVLTDDEAAQAADIIHKVMMMEREHEQTFSLPIPYIGMTAADVLSVQGKRLRVDAMRIERNRVVVERAVYDRPHAFTSTYTGRAGTPPPAPGGNVHGPTDAVLMNVPVLDDDYDKPGIIWAARGYPNTRWIGARLQVQRGSTWETLGDITVACNIGELLADLPIADKWTVDEVNTLAVRLPESMNSISQDAFFSEGNGMAVMKADGTAEILQAQNMVEGDPDEYTGTTLLRGVLDTTPATHASGARVVALNNNLRFVQLRKDDIGKTLTFRVISLGTNPDAAPTQTLTLTTMESQREWQPTDVTVTKLPGCEWQVDFIGRPRLGTDLNPIQSQWFTGWRIDFSIGGTTKSRMTTAESFIYTAAMQVEDWGAVQCAGYVVTVGAVNVYTGSDGGGGAGGGTAPSGNPSYAATFVGGPSDGYVGEPIFDPLGPLWGGPFQAYGGQTEERFIGEIVANVTCQSSHPGAGIVVGIPLVAETRNAATEMIPTGPDVGPGAPFLITDSVTISAKPTYSMMDELKPYGGKVLVTPVTTPARTTKQVTSSGIGGLKSRAGTNTDKVRCEFEITNMPAGSSVAIGVVAAGEDDHLVPGTAGSYGYTVAANGVYVVELDGATGDIEVFEVGVGSVATATLSAAHAYDGLYRFAWRTIGYAGVGTTVRTNMGNEAWPDTPTAGFGGLLNAPTIVPCGFDATVGSANNYWLQGTESLTEATRGGISGEKLVYAYSTFGKSTGKWRIGIAGLNTSRLGFCKAGHTGYLGASGSADSIGFTDTRSLTGYVIETSFGGVFNRIELPAGFYYLNPTIIFAFDIDAGTLAIYVKEEVIAGDPSATYELLTTLTGIPAGTWLPAVNGLGQLSPEIAEPATYNDWTITL